MLGRSIVVSVRDLLRSPIANKMFECDMILSSRLAKQTAANEAPAPRRSSRCDHLPNVAAMDGKSRYAKSVARTLPI